MNQPLPGTVGTQFDALPGGGSGPNQTVTLPPSFACTSPLWLLTLVCLVICMGSPMFAPGTFARNRVFKLAVLALVPPLCYYLVAVTMQGGFGTMEGVAS